MALFLVESTINEVSSKEAFSVLVEQIHTTEGAEVIEVQVAKDFSRGYFIIEAAEEKQAVAAFEAQNVVTDLVKEVRLIGKDLAEVKAGGEQVNYLVEWEIPAEITMDKYLARKKQNSVKY